MKKITLFLCLFVWISTYAQNTQNCGTVTDYDGNTYQTVKLGNQCWMRENLRTTHYADGTEIAMGDNKPSYTTPYRYCPNGDKNNVPTYGYIYNWAAVMGGGASSNSVPSNVQGICPNGWHVPSNAELNNMLDYVASQPQYQCDGNSKKTAKALASTIGWKESSKKDTPGHNSKDNNATGFSAMPASTFSYYFDDPSSFEFVWFGWYAFFWTATEKGSTYAYYRHLSYNNTNSFIGGKINYVYKINAFSVRCIRGSGTFDIKELALRLKALEERKARKARTAEDLVAGFSFLSEMISTANSVYLNTLASSYPTTYNTVDNSYSSESDASSSSSNSSVSHYVPIGTATGVKITESGSVSSISCPVESWNSSGPPSILFEGEHYQLVHSKSSTCNGVNVSQYSYFCHITHGSRILYTVFVNF